MAFKNSLEITTGNQINYIKLLDFLIALRLFHLHQEKNITNNVLFKLLELGLILHIKITNQLHIEDNITISLGDIKDAVLRVDIPNLTDDNARYSAFNQGVVKTSSECTIKLGNILIERNNVIAVYFNMGVSSYPWAKIQDPVKDSDYACSRIIKLEGEKEKFNLDKYKQSSTTCRKHLNFGTTPVQIVSTLLITNKLGKPLLPRQETLKDTKGIGKGKGKRKCEIHWLIWRVYLHLSDEQAKKIKPAMVWQEMISNYKKYDEDIISEVGLNDITWVSRYGNENKFQKKSLSQVLGRLKKNPPF